jgi:hypothetical protein
MLIERTDVTINVRLGQKRTSTTTVLREMKRVRSAPPGYGAGKLCRTEGDRRVPRRRVLRAM